MSDADVVGAILAGGASSRMGRPKAGVPLGGRPLIAHALAAFEAAGLETIVVAKADSALPGLEQRVVTEPTEPRHPLTGILTALRAADGRPVIVAACDMPFLAPSMLAALAAIDAPLAVAETDGHLQPFPGRYSAELADRLEAALEARAPMIETLAAAAPAILGESELRAFGDTAWLCFSVNDEDGLAAAERELDSRS